MLNKLIEFSLKNQLLIFLLLAVSLVLTIIVHVHVSQSASMLKTLLHYERELQEKVAQ